MADPGASGVGAVGFSPPSPNLSHPNDTARQAVANAIRRIGELRAA
jgi:hypothetical protein